MSQIPDLSYCRRYFPSLSQRVNSHPAVYADNPGGTQVPQQVIDAMVAYLRESNANTRGAFVTSQHTDEIVASARQAMADFLHASDSSEIVFGPNMTSLTFAFSRSLARTFQRGDEIVVTILDHDANVAPWLALQEQGIVVRTVDVHSEDVTLDMEDMREKITERTKLVAVGYASNAVGTINDIETIGRWAHEVGALIWVDAVQFAPHSPIDVQSLNVDFLVCSSYKFFGPHIGILYGKREYLERFPVYKARPASNKAPDRWETGTKNHECLAGLLGAIRYLEHLGYEQHDLYREVYTAYSGRQRDLKIAMRAISDYEQKLTAQLLLGLHEIKGVTVYGIADVTRISQRVPTVACTIEPYTPRALAEYLAAHGIFAWDGNYMALGIMERLGLEQRGGALRLGLAHYNTSEEVHRILDCLNHLL